jgi:DNA primase
MIEAIYHYTDERGRPVFRKVRKPDKRFSVQAAVYRNDRLSWKGGKACVRKYQPDWAERALYNLPLVIEALQSRATIVLAEGERDADTIVTLKKVTATTGHQGVRRFTVEQAHWLTMYGGRSRIIVLRDNDDPGIYGAWLRYQRLRAAGVPAKQIRLCRVDGPYKDYTEAVAAVGVNNVKLVRERRAAIKEAAFRVQTETVARYMDEEQAS